MNPPNIGPQTKVIRLKLFLDTVPSSSAEITRALRGCFRGGSVCVAFRFVSTQSETSNALEMSPLIFWLQAKELRLSICFYTFRNFTDSLNKRRMYPAQTITTEWKAEKCLDKRLESKQTPKHKLGNRTKRWSKGQAGACCPNSKKLVKQQR